MSAVASSFIPATAGPEVPASAAAKIVPAAVAVAPEPDPVPAVSNAASPAAAAPLSAPAPAPAAEEASSNPFLALLGVQSPATAATSSSDIAASAPAASTHVVSGERVEPAPVAFTAHVASDADESITAAQLDMPKTLASAAPDAGVPHEDASAGDKGAVTASNSAVETATCPSDSGGSAITVAAEPVSQDYQLPSDEGPVEKVDCSAAADDS